MRVWGLVWGFSSAQPGVTASLWEQHERDHELNPQEKCPDTEILRFARTCCTHVSTHELCSVAEVTRDFPKLCCKPDWEKK